MTQRVIFEAGWEPFFKKYRLSAFDDFFGYGQGETINHNSKRNVTVLELGEGDRKRTFFIKRFIKPHLKDMLSAFCHFGTLCSQAEVEFRNANILLENGIETYHPVCYGVRSHFGIEQRSFFITEEIRGQCLLDYLAESWGNLGTEQREQLVTRLGKFYQKIHKIRIRLPDSYIWHVYRVVCDTAPDGFELGIIDLHRMQIRKDDLRSAAKDLGAFLFSLPDGFMDETLRSLFMDSYLDDARIHHKNVFQEKIQLWETKISNRRKRVLDQIY